MVQAIKSLNINGREHTAKGTYLFVKRAKNIVKTEGDKGLEGYKGIYTGLISEDPATLSDFFRCALLTNFTEEVIDKAIMERLEETGGDYSPLFKGALEVMEYDLQIKGLVQKFWAEIETGRSKAKTEADREEMAGYIQMMTEARDRVLEVNQEQAHQS